MSKTDWLGTQGEIPVPILPSPEEARWVLGYYGLPGGEEPPGFRRALIEAMARADPGNLQRLERGFPGMVTAFVMEHRDLNRLQIIAAADLVNPLGEEL